MPQVLKVALATAACCLGITQAASAAVATTRVITDPFTNSTSQHATAVEPDTFAFGNTIVAASQIGRYFDGGSSGTGFATSTNGGASWTGGALPGLTIYSPQPGTHTRATDPSVAYDAAHNTWLIQSLVLDEGSGGPTGVGVAANRSTNGGLTWSVPSVITAGPGQDFDKNWIACDNFATSPFYGHCYATWDNFGDGDRILMSTSTDGGQTWSAPAQTADHATGLGGQPVVQPNGTVIVPGADAFETSIIAWRSTNGGASWSSSVKVADAITHAVAGNLRSGPLPSAEIDAAGKAYVVWQDCRFRSRCKTNDIVMSTSTTGTTWSSVARVPIDSTTSGVDHFLPGIGVDPATSGSTARLGLTYYLYRNARCGRKTCKPEVGYVQSNDGGSTWSNQTDVAGPMAITSLADTSQGRMVGDYISTSWVGGRAFGAFAIGLPPSNGVFDEAMYVPTGGLTAAAGGFVNTSNGEHPVSSAASDHASPHSAIRRR